jgi:hypothetical protein
MSQITGTGFRSVGDALDDADEFGTVIAVRAGVPDQVAGADLPNICK